VDSITTDRIPHCCNQSASAFRSRVNVGKLRTGCWSRSALTATNSSLAPTSIPAASGCRIGNSSHRLLGFFAFFASWFLRGAGRMSEARIKDKLPIEIVVRRTNVITHLCANPGPTLIGRASKSSTNVGAGYSCHPTSADHLRSPRVPFHLWPTPVARLSGLTALSTSRLEASRLLMLLSASPQVDPLPVQLTSQRLDSFVSTDVVFGGYSETARSVFRRVVRIGLPTGCHWGALRFTLHAEPDACLYQRFRLRPWTKGRNPGRRRHSE